MNKEGKSKLTGQKFYLNDAISNVNQTLGRVLRHKNDYGVLICIDERYEVHYKNKLFSKWIRDKCEIINILDDKYIASFKEFFNLQDKRFNEEKNNIKNKNINIKENIINKNENIINKDENISLSITNLNEEKEENNNSNNIQNKKFSLLYGNIFKNEKKEIKYEFEENDDDRNKKNINNINEIIDSKEVINALEKKYLKNNNDLELLNKKTNPKENYDNINNKEFGYNNEDINPNELKIKEKKENFIKDKKNY